MYPFDLMVEYFLAASARSTAKKKLDKSTLETGAAMAALVVSLRGELRLRTQLSDSLLDALVAEAQSAPAPISAMLKQTPLSELPFQRWGFELDVEPGATRLLRVEGTIEAKTEPPLRHIELGTADAKVRQNQGCRPRRAVISKVGGHDGDPFLPGAETRCGRRSRCGVLVEPDQAQPWITVQQQTAVPASAQGGIHNQARLPVVTGLLVQRLQQNIGQHRHMLKG